MSENKSKEKTRGAGRTRNFATVVYPESAPVHWLDIVSSSKVPCFVSPLHDKDTNPDNTVKKAHYHVIAMFESVKTNEQAVEFFKTFNGVGCEVVKSLRSYARYLCHMDNPDKYQYSRDDVKSFGGADYIYTIGTAADKTKSIREMISFINEQDVTCFADLMLYASENRSDWFDTLINSGAYVIKEYIKSYTWKYHHTEEK